MNDSTLSNYDAYSTGEVTCEMTIDQNNQIISETVTVVAGYDWIRFTRYKSSAWNSNLKLKTSISLRLIDEEAPTWK